MSLQLNTAFTEAVWKPLIMWLMSHYLLVRDSISESSCLSMDPKLCLLLMPKEESRSHWSYSTTYCEARGTMIQAHEGLVDVLCIRTVPRRNHFMYICTNWHPSHLTQVFNDFEFKPCCHLTMSCYQILFFVHFHNGIEVHFNCSFHRRALWAHLKRGQSPRCYTLGRAVVVWMGNYPPQACLDHCSPAGGTVWRPLWNLWGQGIKPCWRKSITGRWTLKVCSLAPLPVHSLILLRGDWRCQFWASWLGCHHGLIPLTL